jgi:hypothetical protein
LGVPQAGSVDIFVKEALQVVTRGNLSALAALLREPQSPLIADIAKAPALQLRHGSNARGRVDQRRNGCAISQPNNGGCIDRPEKLPGVLNRDFRRFALDYHVSFAAHTGGGVEHDGVPRHQYIENVPDGGQVLFFGGDRSWMLIEVLTNILRRYLLQRQTMNGSPSEKPPDSTLVRNAGVLVPQLAEQKLFICELSISSGTGDQRRQRLARNR